MEAKIDTNIIWNRSLAWWPWPVNRGDHLLEGYFIVITLPILSDSDMWSLNRRWPFNRRPCTYEGFAWG